MNLPVPLRMLSLHQPYASLVAEGHKKVDTRGWQTGYRGWLAIHATKSIPKEMKPSFYRCHQAGMIADEPPFGAIVCLVHLEKIIPTREAKFTISPLERSLGNYETGRFAWIFSDRRILQPIACQGGQSIRLVPGEVLRQIFTQLEASIA